LRLIKAQKRLIIGDFALAIEELMLHFNSLKSWVGI